MNGYVAGGWGATAGILALYSWRLLRRGRLLTRALPPEPAGTDQPPAALAGIDDPPASPAAVTEHPHPAGSSEGSPAQTGEAGAWR